MAHYPEGELPFATAQITIFYRSFCFCFVITQYYCYRELVIDHKKYCLLSDLKTNETRSNTQQIKKLRPDIKCLLLQHSPAAPSASSRLDAKRNHKHRGTSPAEPNPWRRWNWGTRAWHPERRRSERTLQRPPPEVWIQQRHRQLCIF